MEENDNNLNGKFVLWMTGLPCAGKSSIAKELKKHVPNLAILDGDELREWLSSKDFTREGRNEHNRKVAHLAKLLASHNIPVCVALVSPYEENRTTARKIIGESFSEVYVKCSRDTCETRDVKGMYKLAREGKISNFTGLSDPYEPPSNPELILDTEKMDLQDCVKSLLQKVRRH